LNPGGAFCVNPVVELKPFTGIEPVFDDYRWNEREAAEFIATGQFKRCYVWQ
jgi:hypothetical protein